MTLMEGLLLAQIVVCALLILPSLGVVIYRTGRAAEVLERTERRVEEHSDQLRASDVAMLRITQAVEEMAGRLSRIEKRMETR